MNKIVKNIPNALTISRIMSCIIGSAMFITGNVTSAIICYLYGAVSDAFDGFLARKLDAVTEFGKKLDPISDKIYALSLMLPSIILGNYSMIIPLILESIISSINLYSELKYNATYTELVGKFKTVALFPTMILGLGIFEIPMLKYVYFPSLITSATLQLASIKAYTNQLKRNKRSYEKNMNSINSISLDLEELEENNYDLSYTNTYSNSNNYTENKVKKLVRKREHNDRY